MNGTLPLLDIINLNDDSVVLKASESFPDYRTGDDVDLLVLDRHDAIEIIYRFFEAEYINKGELRIADTANHCHIDFIFDDILDLRIDIISTFDFYKKISVKNSFVTKIFKDRIKIQHADKYYYVPSREDDLTIRYFEYLEYFHQRPDKIKHLEYITNINDINLKKRFFDNTHKYIAFKRKQLEVPKLMLGNPDGTLTRRQAVKSILTNFKFLFRETFRKPRSDNN